ncbi:MAG TPA: trypsin-like peptidase domain-containing protein [Chloroflexota bacterium]|nr:trypsin-like peptidase domain-containing protein [Chloroflexota bacterium]
MSERSGDGSGVLASFSDGLADAVGRAGDSVVRVEGRRRQAASGVAWQPDGLVITADHVLEREEDLSVGLPDGRSVGAKIVGRDPGTDLALLRLEVQGLRPIERGRSPRVGHLALVVARPGPSLATSIGVVSALGGPARSWRGGRLDGFILTDATFYPGFSGGPLVDAAGQMVGLATSHFGQGTGLAIPLETVERISSALLSHGSVKRAFLGLSSQPVELPDALRTSLGGQESGLLVVGVEPNGPAERGGLMLGDLLVTLGGRPIRHTEDLRALLGPEQVGQATSARIIRGGEVRDLNVTIGERE